MKREDFDTLLKELRGEIDSETNGYCAVEDSEYIHNNDIDFEEVQSKIIDQSRWSVMKEVVFKIADTYFISVVWNDPATEMQDGQDTDCTIYEVEPKEKTIIEYSIVNKP